MLRKTNYLIHQNSVVGALVQAKPGGKGRDKAVYIDMSLEQESSTKLSFEEGETTKRIDKYKS